MFQVQELCKSYDKEGLALDHVSFLIEEGKKVALLGLNGAGKTTIFRLIAGYLIPSSGSCFLHGKDIFDVNLEFRQKISYLPENPPLYLDLKVGDYLQFICQMKQIVPSKIAFEVKKVCESLDLVSKIKEKISTLSLGYKKRVGIAQALLGNPSLILMDEPISGLDSEQIIGIRNIIQTIDAKITVIISSHILSELEKMCSQFLFLHHGKIIGNFSREELNRKINQTSSFKIIIGGKSKESIEEYLKNCGECEIVLVEKHFSGFEFEISPISENEFFSLFFTNLHQNHIRLELFQRKEFHLNDFFLKYLKNK